MANLTSPTSGKIHLFCNSDNMPPKRASRSSVVDKQKKLKLLKIKLAKLKGSEKYPVFFKMAEVSKDPDWVEICLYFAMGKNPLKSKKDNLFNYYENEGKLTYKTKSSPYIDPENEPRANLRIVKKFLHDSGYAFSPDDIAMFTGRPVKTVNTLHDVPGVNTNRFLVDWVTKQSIKKNIVDKRAGINALKYFILLKKVLSPKDITVKDNSIENMPGITCKWGKVLWKDMTLKEYQKKLKEDEEKSSCSQHSRRKVKRKIAVNPEEEESGEAKSNPLINWFLKDPNSGDVAVLKSWVTYSKVMSKLSNL